MASKPLLVLWALVAAIAVVGSWLIASGPAGDFRTVSLSGYERADHDRIETIVEEAVRTGNMLSIPTDDVREAARRSPWIDDVAFRRRFPLTLEVVVLPARPVAVGVPAKGKSVLISSRGLVLGPAGKGKKLPRMRLPGASPKVGERIPKKARPAWRFARAAEDTDVYPRLRGLRMRNRDLVGHLVEGPRLVLGTPEELRRKALSLNLVYSALSPDDRRESAYLDVTLPDRPAVGAPPSAADLIVDTSGSDPPAVPDAPASDAEPTPAPVKPSATPLAPSAPPEVPPPPSAPAEPAPEPAVPVEPEPAPSPDPSPGPQTSDAPATPAPAVTSAPGPISSELDGASAPPPP